MGHYLCSRLKPNELLSTFDIRGYLFIKCTVCILYKYTFGFYPRQAENITLFFQLHVFLLYNCLQ